MSRIVVIGSTNVDLTFRVGQLPRPGETVPGRALHTGHGGKGANQAVMAARLGAEVTFLSAVGDDDFGRQALANLRTHGIDTSFVRISQQPTGTAAILVDDTARNVIVVVAGANGALSADDVRAAKTTIESADAVVAQMETPAEATIGARPGLANSNAIVPKTVSFRASLALMEFSRTLAASPSIGAIQPSRARAKFPGCPSRLKRLRSRCEILHWLCESWKPQPP